MSLSLYRYSSLHAKVRVMLARSLTSADYEELVVKRSVQDVAAYLKYNTHYQTILDEINETTIHRGQLEKVFKKVLINDYIKLFRFVQGNAKAFLKLAFLRYEIEDLKILLRVLDTEHNTQLVHDSLIFLRKYSTIDIENVASSKDIQQFIQNLKGSIYYDVLSPFITNTQHLNLFSIEMSLDMYFFTRLWKQKDKLLKNEDHKAILQSFGSEIDILNILWIYRCKKYYNTPKEIIYSYTIPFTYRISKAQLINMVEAKTPEEVLELVQTTKYNQIFLEGKEYFYEQNFTYYVYKLHKRLLMRQPFSIASLMAYLHLKEIEIRNIISIIEGIRYQLSPDQIKKYIVAGLEK
ncbi:V-type ATPase subunit [Petroclostridium sp. X23]|uniref:V-type ATPase subunit n=1 Tax=Petroclostridium sp. X23 TaxID=3045146 RepID=UPI0024AE1D29|nr:V-type ATPase subunit [Petroclostridium sp. X23]WHH61225.1 V-type ATPase subunit [Petroclostridium sp. X23]